MSSAYLIHCTVGRLTVLIYHHGWVISWGLPFLRLILSIGISRTSRHKRSATGAQKSHYRKKRKFELGRQPANTRLGPKRVHTVRTRGGNTKFRALRLESGNFAWGSEHVTKKTRIIGVSYNASNNELVRTNTLVKAAIIQIDATPFRQWYEAHVSDFACRRRLYSHLILQYATPVSKKGAHKSVVPSTTDEPVKKSNHAQRSLDAKKKGTSCYLTWFNHRYWALTSESKIDPLLESQFGAGRLYACISSRPGQSGRADGYVLEGKELEFYLRKLRTGKMKHAHAA